MVSMTEAPLQMDARLVDAVHAIESTHRRIAVVVDQDQRVMGTLTDGDVRRCLLRGGTLETPAAEAMSRRPITCSTSSSDAHILELMNQGHIEALPSVDDEGRLVRLVHITDISGPQSHFDGRADFAFAVIMAGGEGMRLRPITETIPKPMVDIGGLPLIEHQIRRLVRAGIRQVYISLNYLGHVIESHFGDGSDFGVRIRYLREDRKLGTAGALTLLPEKPEAPIIVMNGDILTTCDFSGLFDFHISHDAAVTVGAVDYHVNIPFGVIQSEGPRVTGLAEKPSQRFLCNAGIYAVSPEALDLLPGMQFWNMTDMIESCITSSQQVVVFPVHEYWSDVGTPDDLEKARAFIRERPH